MVAPGSRGPEPSRPTTRATATRLPDRRNRSMSSRTSFTPPSLRVARPASGRLDRDLDVDARGEVEALQRVDRLGAVLDDVDQALVHPHLEVLAAVLVLVRRPDHGVAVLLRGQRYRPPDLRLGAQDRLDDLLRRLVERLVVVGLEADADLLLVGHGYLLILTT